jgi:hypothetical protein
MEAEHIMFSLRYLSKLQTENTIFMKLQQRIREISQSDNRFTLSDTCEILKIYSQVSVSLTSLHEFWQEELCSNLDKMDEDMFRDLYISYVQFKEPKNNKLYILSELDSILVGNMDVMKVGSLI